MLGRPGPKKSASSSKRSKQQRKYNSQPQQKKNRAQRNLARATAIRAGRVKKGDGKDIDHKKPLRSGGSNAVSNTRVVKQSINRANNGKTGGRKKKR